METLQAVFLEGKKMSTTDIWIIDKNWNGRCFMSFLTHGYSALLPELGRENGR